MLECLLLFKNLQIYRQFINKQKLTNKNQQTEINQQKLLIKDQLTIIKTHIIQMNIILPNIKQCKIKISKFIKKYQQTLKKYQLKILILILTLKNISLMAMIQAFQNLTDKKSNLNEKTSKLTTNKKIQWTKNQFNGKKMKFIDFADFCYFFVRYFYVSALFFIFCSFQVGKAVCIYNYIKQSFQLKNMINQIEGIQELFQTTNTTFQKEQQYYDSNQMSIQCEEFKDALYYCFNQKCTAKSIFICGIKKCKCYQQHPLCPKGNIQGSLEVIKSKIKKTSQLQSQIQIFFDEMCEEINNLRTHLLREVENKIKYIQLYQSERLLYLISLKKVEATYMTGKIGADLWKSVNIKNQCKYDLFECIRYVLNDYVAASNQSINKAKDQVDSFIKYQQLIPIVNSQDKQIKKQRKKQQKLQISSLLISSQVSQFFNKKVKKINLLFKASLSNFSLKTYYQVCGNQTHTIIIAKTNKNKVFGAYTPLNFWSGKEGWAIDYQKQSFLFSLNENQKIPLTSAKFAIKRFSSMTNRIQFGNDFCIYDKANQNQNNVVGNRDSYTNPIYQDDSQSFMKLNGNSTSYCQLKQWQVYKVEFQ